MLRRLHRWNAAALSVFLILHIGNHLVLIAGTDSHIAVMGLLRVGYRAAIIEPILISLFAAQIILGLALIWQRGRPRGGWAWAQVISGGYIGFFLLQHVPAIIAARRSFPDMDTNVTFAASVVALDPIRWYFAPYYIFAIFAIFTHVAAALRFRIWPEPANTPIKLLPVVGLVAGCIVTAGLAGLLHPLELTPDNWTYLRETWGLTRP